MRFSALVLSWVKKVTGAVLGWDPRPVQFRDTLPDLPRPLSLRDTLPDHSRPTVPERLARPWDARPTAPTGHPSGASNYAK